MDKDLGFEFFEEKKCFLFKAKSYGTNLFSKKLHFSSFAFEFSIATFRFCFATFRIWFFCYILLPIFCNILLLFSNFRSFVSISEHCHRQRKRRFLEETFGSYCTVYNVHTEIYLWQAFVSLTVLLCQYKHITIWS